MRLRKEVDSRLGRQSKIEIILYDERAKYGLTRVIKESTDPVAATIALNEMLDLMEIQRRQRRQSPLGGDIELVGGTTNSTFTARSH